MTAILENNTISRLGSLESQDFNKEVNSADSNSTTALVHKEGYKEKPLNLQNKHNSICPLPSVKNTTPHGEVTIQFAAKQLFQILLVNVKYIHSKSVSDLDLLDVPSESNPLII